MVHKALDLAVPGDIIVVDAGGDLTNAIIGEIMVGYAVKLGLGGFVINGSIRDAGPLRAGTLPVYAAGVTHRGPYKDGPGEINVPISIDGMVINPGDLMIGDEDGTLCVPFDDVEAILAAGQHKSTLEAKMIAQMANGTYDSSWVDATLKRIGCSVEE
jgi:regulator of RNase E activity RraA